MKNNNYALNKRSIRILFALMYICLIIPGLFTNLAAQVVINHPEPNGATGDYGTTWTVPDNVNAVTVEAWGGGAGASYFSLYPQFNIGGQGGAYAKVVNYPVMPGDVLDVTIGGGGQAGSYCGGNTSVTKSGNLILRARGGAFFFANCACYDYYVSPGTNCTNDTSVNLVEDGVATNTVDGGNAGGIAAGGGLGGIYPGGNGSVPGGGAATDTATGSGTTRMGASGRVKISYVITGISSANRVNPFHIYPNPAAGIYHLSMNTPDNAPADIYIYDLPGKTVYENRNISAPDLFIDISGNAKGLYILKVVSGGKVFLSRLAYM